MNFETIIFENLGLVLENHGSYFLLINLDPPNEKATWPVLNREEWVKTLRAWDKEKTMDYYETIELINRYRFN